MLRRAAVRRFGADLRAVRRLTVLRRLAGALRFAVLRRLGALRRLAARRGFDVERFFVTLEPYRETAASVLLNIPRTAACSALSFG